MKNETKIGIGALTAASAGLAAYHHAKKKPTVDGTGKSALITGGSSGIGLELAKLYADSGYQVILAARSEEKLRKAKEEIGGEVITIPADLSTREGNEALYREITEDLKIDIDELINSAGAGKTGRLIDTDPEVLEELVGLNTLSMTILNRLFGADMAKRGSGMIMNVGSLSSFLPDPFLNVYGATKAYDLLLTEAMMGELDGTGVQVCVLCPGPVKTGWSTNAGRQDSRLSLDAKTVAREGFMGMHQGKWLIIPTLPYRSFKRFMDLLPVPVKVKFLSAFQKRLKP